MLLIHQAGSVKVGEVVRYTLTYTPSSDRILPSPSLLHVKIKNTSSIPLRAAYLHGPYTLHVSAYPSKFNPNHKFDTPRLDGVPQFEPNLKAGGHWTATLTIPENIRESGDKANIKRNIDGSPKTVTWAIDITSQILFSNTASVHYELLVGRDRRSLDLGFAAVAGKGHGEPGQINDYRKQDSSSHHHHRHSPPKGVYSKAIELVVEDTAALWSKPALPEWAVEKDANEKETKRPQKKRKLHLVVLTHGLHSNLGADFLYMKESIDAAANQAYEEAQKRKKRDSQKRGSSNPRSSKAQTSGASIEKNESTDQNFEGDDSDDEQVMVRGFNGNAVRTERGIKYLGKRLARYILTTTYPDQPFLPTVKSSFAKTLTGSFSTASKPQSGTPSHGGSTIRQMAAKSESLPYTFTSISFLGHSLGGLIQTYAIAYINKHSPEFFKKIRPINFVCLASPMLGLSNENPLYVKFALDFGLVGRTGQDLGLTWRPPTLARSGWSAMISGFGAGGGEKQAPKQQDPQTKPLLRVLPTGPAHEVLKMFRNRTVYSNVVNDGIVPLRTSCLLFLDWRGLGKVENARRENGLIGTMAAFGWAELTGANSMSHRPSTARIEDDQDSDSEIDEPLSKQSTRRAFEISQDIPVIASGISARSEKGEPEDHQFLSQVPPEDSKSAQQLSDADATKTSLSEAQANALKSYTLPQNPLTDFINFFRPAPNKSQSSLSTKPSKKTLKTYKRAQTLKPGQTLGDVARSATDSPPEEEQQEEQQQRPVVTRGDSLLEDPNAVPPPKTSIFDAAGDILNPPLPPESWLIDPSMRNRTIFHDRIYYPDDIPPPPTRKPKLSRSFSSSGSLTTAANSQSSTDGAIDSSGMRVEEKIARAYHSEMSWRKVLVRLEPDAHNNIIVRRTFANAFGWDVVKHICDVHFSTLYTSKTKEDEEAQSEHVESAQQSQRALSNQFEVKASTKRQNTTNELREARDQLQHLEVVRSAHGSLKSSASHPDLRKSRSQDSGAWNDALFDDDDDDDYGWASDEEIHSPFDTFHRFWGRSPKGGNRRTSEADPHNLSVQTQTPEKKSDNAEAEIADHLTQSPLVLNSSRGSSAFAPPQSAVKPTYNADAIEPLMTEEANPQSLVERDSMINPSSMAKLGLQKPPEAIATTSSNVSSSLKRQPSVTETVARASLSSAEKKPD